MRRWSQPWLATSCPASWIDRTNPGSSLATCPTMKNVARMARSSSCSRIHRVARHIRRRYSSRRAGPTSSPAAASIRWCSSTSKLRTIGTASRAIRIIGPRSRSACDRARAARPGRGAASPTSSRAVLRTSRPGPGNPGRAPSFRDVQIGRYNPNLGRSGVPPWASRPGACQGSSDGPRRPVAIGRRDATRSRRRDGRLVRGAGACWRRARGRRHRPGRGGGATSAWTSKMRPDVARDLRISSDRLE